MTAFTWDKDQQLFLAWIGDGHRQILWNVASAVHALLIRQSSFSQLMSDGEQILYPSWLAPNDSPQFQDEDPAIRVLLGVWSQDEEVDAQSRELCDDSTARTKALRAAILRRVLSAGDGQQAQFHCPTLEEQAFSDFPVSSLCISPAPLMSEELSLADDLQGTCVAVNHDDVDDFLAALNDIRLLLAQRIGADQPDGPTVDFLIAKRNEQAESEQGDGGITSQTDGASHASQITELCEDAYLFTSWWQESLLDLLFSS
ncbi:DUF2017 family protein [Actinomyces vulturis]|uniref:DUF2017 family protein n=1 Tax=Actinomyces vulturis TaxID=1857645 RepID=UPI00082E115E|nr:DUF2017 family protein [Actinomyces vulturis]